MFNFWVQVFNFGVQVFNFRAQVFNFGVEVFTLWVGMVVSVGGSWEGGWGSKHVYPELFQAQKSKAVLCPVTQDLCHSSFSLMASSSASVSSSSGWPTLASGSGGPQGAGSKKLAPGSFSTLSDRRTPLKQSHQIDGNAQRQQSAFRWTKNSRE